jgi:hypothetical protein
LDPIDEFGAALMAFGFAFAAKRFSELRGLPRGLRCRALDCRCSAFRRSRISRDTTKRKAETRSEKRPRLGFLVLLFADLINILLATSQPFTSLCSHACNIKPRNDFNPRLRVLCNKKEKSFQKQLNEIPRRLQRHYRHIRGGFY